MPGRNGQGPIGQGPLTGRGMGPCAEGYAYGCGRMGAGRRSGAGAGLGLKMGRGFFGYSQSVEINTEKQREILTERKAMLEDELQALQKKLSEL